MPEHVDESLVRIKLQPVQQPTLTAINRAHHMCSQFCFLCASPVSLSHDVCLFMCACFLVISEKTISFLIESAKSSVCSLAYKPMALIYTYTLFIVYHLWPCTLIQTFMSNSSVMARFVQQENVIAPLMVNQFCYFLNYGYGYTEHLR